MINIIIISEESCDSEDTENSALHHMNELHFKIYQNRIFLKL